jgi:hypothetical protein
MQQSCQPQNHQNVGHFFLYIGEKEPLSSGKILYLPIDLSNHSYIYVGLSTPAYVIVALIHCDPPKGARHLLGGGNQMVPGTCLGENFSKKLTKPLDKI